MKNYVKMIHLVSIAISLFWINALSAQHLKRKELRTLTQLGVPYSDYDLTDEKIRSDFRKTIELHSRRKGQTIAGAILLPVGAVAVGFGASKVANAKSIEERFERMSEEDGYEYERRGGYGGGTGAVLMLLGSVKIVVGTTMFFTAKRKKRKKAELLSKYNAQALATGSLESEYSYDVNLPKIHPIK